MVFQFLFSLGQVFEGYFGEEYDEDAIRNNFTLVYELLDGRRSGLRVLLGGLPPPPLLACVLLPRRGVGFRLSSKLCAGSAAVLHQLRQRSRTCWLL
jgi:hypothetical protein